MRTLLGEWTALESRATYDAARSELHIEAFLLDFLDEKLCLAQDA